jgi:hypothetical protein
MPLVHINIAKKKERKRKGKNTVFQFLMNINSSKDYSMELTIERMVKENVTSEWC